jgi:DNA-binding CsgD family transcriptional regulator
MGAADEARTRQFSLELQSGERLFVLSMPCEGRAHLLRVLSPAERQVLTLVLSGCTNAEISCQRGVSVHTVANQLKSVFKKLGCSGRVELVAMLSGADLAETEELDAGSP